MGTHGKQWVPRPVDTGHRKHETRFHAYVLCPLGGIPAGMGTHNHETVCIPLFSHDDWEISQWTCDNRHRKHMFMLVRPPPSCVCLLACIFACFSAALLACLSACLSACLPIPFAARLQGERVKLLFWHSPWSRITSVAQARISV
jgi:hypothetical protein